MKKIKTRWVRNGCGNVSDSTRGLDNMTMTDEQPDVWGKLCEALSAGEARILTKPELAKDIQDFLRSRLREVVPASAIISDTPCQRCGAAPSTCFEVWYVDTSLSLQPMALCEDCGLTQGDLSADRRLFSPEQRAAMEQFDIEHEARVERRFG